MRKMLLSATLIISSLYGLSLAQDDRFRRGVSKEVKVFKVSKTGKNKDLLLRLFEEIRSQEASKSAMRLNAFMKTFYIRQRLSSTTYLVDWEGDEPYWFVAKNSLTKVDGDVIRCLAKVTNEIKSYTTVLKAKKTVRVIKEVEESELNIPPPDPPLTKERFLEELRSGQTWVVTLADECKTCGGSGKLKSVSGTRACNSCRNPNTSSVFRDKGLGVHRVTYSVQW